MKNSDRLQELTVTVIKVKAPWKPAYEAFLLEVMKHLEVTRWDVSITLCDDAFIQELNRDWRGKDEPTDVLSFEADPDDDPFEEDRGEEGGLHGALVISLDMLKTNSAYFQVDFEEELKRVSIHGFLHLLGWDHKTNEAHEPMLEYQEKILSKLKDIEFEK